MQGSHLLFMNNTHLEIIIMTQQLTTTQYMHINAMANEAVIIFTGESIPIRLFLSPYELTPTHRNINNKFSVKYFLNLVLVDEEDRRYFKQQEITIYRLQETSN